MTNVVRLYRDAAETHGRDLFSCSISRWQLLLELGRTFGWQPEGTTYELPSGSKLTAAALRDYDPGSPADRKLISAQDAANWARALEKAQSSDHLPSIIERQLGSAEAEGDTIAAANHSIDEFIEYAFGGAFVFALEQD